MAKAKEIPELTADMTYAEAAARTVAVRAGEVFEHREGVLDTSDIERVHAMRVATRRLRAVLEVYAPCFRRSELRPVLRDVKALADALGARRDPDVELRALEEFEASVGPEERSGVQLFAARTEAEQADGNHVLAQALREIDASDLRGRLERLTESVRGADGPREHDDEEVGEEDDDAVAAAPDGAGDQDAATGAPEPIASEVPAG